MSIAELQSAVWIQSEDILDYRPAWAFDEESEDHGSARPRDDARPPQPAGPADARTVELDCRPGSALRG